MKTKAVLIIFSFFLISCDDATQDGNEINNNSNSVQISNSGNAVQDKHDTNNAADDKTPIRTWKTIDSGYEFVEYK